MRKFMLFAVALAGLAVAADFAQARPRGFRSRSVYVAPVYSYSGYTYPAYTYDSTLTAPAYSYYGTTPAYTYDTGVAPAAYYDTSSFNPNYRSYYGGVPYSSYYNSYYGSGYPGYNGSYYTPGYYNSPGFYSPGLSVNRYGTSVGGMYVPFRR